MYKSHLTKIDSSLGGNGVITNVSIPADVPILEFRGDLFSRATLKHEMERVIQIGPDMFLGPSGDLDDYLNHSCNPNCSVKIVGRRAILFSLYVIPVNAELTWDYSTTSTDSLTQWSMDCKCGDFNCRKKISGFYSLDESTRENYIRRGMIPMFLTNPVFRTNT